MVGAADPFQLFRIMCEIVAGRRARSRSGVAYMLDQCHNIEPKVAGQIRSVMNVQEATAKALLVDRRRARGRAAPGDVLGAHGALMDAFATDVRPLLAEMREEQGFDGDPMQAYVRLGLRRVRSPRSAASTARPGWGS